MRRFMRDQRGNIAITFALALVPMCILVGGAIDFSRAMTAKRLLRDTLDGAALAIAGTPNFTQTEAETIATNFATANFPTQDMSSAAHIDSVVFDTDMVTITGSADVPTTMLDLIGMDNIKVTTDTTVNRAGANVEVSLVLDVTGSMAGTRIADLKTAANDFVDIVVQDQQSPYYSKVALVPFSMAVNVGTYADQIRGVIPAGTSNAMGSQKFKFTPAANPPGCKSNCTQTFTVSTCVTERNGVYKFSDDSPSTKFMDPNYPASNNPCLPSVITPMSADKAALKSAINSYTATGSTAGHIGIAWGWYMLSPNFNYLWPSEGKAAAYGAKNTYKNAVIMTDGDFNTVYCQGVIARDALSGSGNTYDHINCDSGNGKSSADQAKSLCDNMKAKGIIVYTIGFDIGTSAVAKDVLSYCASDSSKFYQPSTGSEMKSVFKTIAKSIYTLRIAH